MNNTKHIGDLTITKANRKDFEHITEVTGYLYIGADAQLPVLTSVGGSLYIGADAQLPVLTSVGGYLYIKADAQLPVLTSVGGYLYVSYGTEFDHSAIEFGAGDVIAVWEYALHVKDGFYTAGCRGPWTKERALAHWKEGHHAPSRAKAFQEAIQVASE